uniref:Uncharacterized protein n=1 Tax=Populus trichocarpa TaxID=3694 RepID=A0A2K2AIF2_POPTR
MGSLQQEQQLCDQNANTSPGKSERIAALDLDGQSRPGFLVSLAYLDPGNLETDLQAGANHGYDLLWVILIGLIFALAIRSLAANLGVSTGKYLSELCKVEYPKFWLQAEVAVVAADIPGGMLLQYLTLFF